MGLCDVLWDFVQKNEKVDLQKLQWALKFDIALHEKPKKLPVWLKVGGNGQEYERITAKLVQKYILCLDIRLYVFRIFPVILMSYLIMECLVLILLIFYIAS